MCQYLAMEISKPVGLEQSLKVALKTLKRLPKKSSTLPGYHLAKVLTKPKAKPKTKKQVPPPSQIVSMIMEMGFRRPDIEYAVKTTGVLSWLQVGIGVLSWLQVCIGVLSWLQVGVGVLSWLQVCIGVLSWLQVCIRRCVVMATSGCRWKLYIADKLQGWHISSFNIIHCTMCAPCTCIDVYTCVCML